MKEAVTIGKFTLLRDDIQRTFTLFNGNILQTCSIEELNNWIDSLCINFPTRPETLKQILEFIILQG